MELAAMQKFLTVMPKKHRDRIIELLKFPEDTVGGTMTNEFISFPAETTAGEATEKVQPQLEEVHFSSVVYVVDDEANGRLRGAVNLKDMLAAEKTAKLEDIMDPYLQSLDPFSKAYDAAYRIVSSQLPAMPVIDKDTRLIGVMTVEAAVSRLVPNTSSLQRLRVFS
jgi:magnesium transporter